MDVASRLARMGKGVEADQILVQEELKTRCPSFVLCSLLTYCPRFPQGIVLLGTKPFSQLLADSNQNRICLLSYSK